MNASLWQLAGWTMIHSLWIGAAVALAGGILRLATRRAAPHTRYAISLATLAALAISPLAASAWLSVNGVPQLAATNTESPLLPLPLGEGWGEDQPVVSGPQLASSMGGAQDTLQPEYQLLHPSLTLPIEGRGPENRQANAPAPLVIDLAHSDPSPRYSGERLGEGQNLLTSMPFATAIAQSDISVTNPSPNRSANSTALRSLATGDRAQLLPSLPERGTPAPLTYSPTNLLTYSLAAAIPYLPILWLVGAPLTFTLLAAGLVGSERLRRRATPLVAGPAFDACQRMRTALRITRRVALAACDGVAQPVLVGVFRPLILLPTAALAGWTPEQLDMILLHELAHVRRWDNLANLLQRIVESLLFYHPAVWILSRQVRHDREECCDATVIRHTDRPHQYAELLVSIAAALRGGPAPSLAVASAMASHPLAGRIRRILNIEAEPMRITRRTLAATLLLPAILAGAILYSGANAEDASTSPPSQEQPSTVASDDRAQGGSAEAGGIPDASQPNKLATDEQAEGGSADVGGISDANQPSTVASEETTPADSNVSTDADTPNASQPNAPTSQEPASANSAANDLAAEIARLEPLVQQHRKDFVERDVLKTILSNDSLSSQLIEQSIRDSVHRAPDVESATKRLRETKNHLAHLAHADAPLDETKIRRLQQLRGQLTQEVADAEENYVKQQQAIFDSIPRDRLHQGLRERLARIEKSLAQSEEHATDLALAKRMADARKTTLKPAGGLSSSDQGYAAPVQQPEPHATHSADEISQLQTQISGIEAEIRSTQVEITNLEVFNKLTQEQLPPDALIDKAVAAALKDDKKLESLEKRILDIEEGIAAEELNLAKESSDKDSDTLMRLRKLRETAELDRNIYLSEATKAIRDRTTKPGKEAINASEAQYKTRRKAADEKLAKLQQELAAARQTLSQLGVDAPAGGPGSPNQGGAATRSPDNDAHPTANASPGSAAPVQEPEPPVNPTTAPDPRLANLLPLTTKDFASHFIVAPDNHLSEYTYQVDPDLLPAIGERLDAALDLLRANRTDPPPKFVVNYQTASRISIIAAERAQHSLLVDQTTGRPAAGLRRVGRSYSSPPTHFPTLEHQKIADRAYKLLGLELEPLNPEDLERVKKIGYTGGLKIAQVAPFL